MSVLAWLWDVWRAFSGALRLDRDVLASIANSQSETMAAVGVAIIAGAAMMLGHSGILLINGVRRLHFVAAILLTGVQTVMLYLVHAFWIYLLDLLLVPNPMTFGAVARSVMVSAAPLAFGFWILIPYAGPMIARCLQLWSFSIMISIIGPLNQVGTLHALGIVALSWLATQILGRVASHPIDWVLSKVWLVATGVPALLSPRDVLAGHPLVEVAGEVGNARG